MRESARPAFSFEFSRSFIRLLPTASLHPASGGDGSGVAVAGALVAALRDMFHEMRDEVSVSRRKTQSAASACVCLSPISNRLALACSCFQRHHGGLACQARYSSGLWGDASVSDQPHKFMPRAFTCCQDWAMLTMGPDTVHAPLFLAPRSGDDFSAASSGASK